MRSHITFYYMWHIYIERSKWFFVRLCPTPSPPQHLGWCIVAGLSMPHWGQGSSPPESRVEAFLRRAYRIDHEREVYWCSELEQLIRVQSAPVGCDPWYTGKEHAHSLPLFSSFSVFVSVCACVSVQFPFFSKAKYDVYIYIISHSFSLTFQFAYPFLTTRKTPHHKHVLFFV